MLKKVSLFPLSPGLSVFRMVPLFFPIILLLSLMTTCQEPEENDYGIYPRGSLSLEVLDASCTEAWLRVTLHAGGDSTTTSPPASIMINRGGEQVVNFTMTPGDTMIIDEGLEVDRTYTYTAYRQSVHNSALVDSSNTLSLTTMDTTSHDFSFETFTFGGEPGTGSSGFYDVAIIDENNIWAVGEIYVPDPDSSWNGTGWKDYSVAQWDGEEWNLKVLQAGSVNVHPRGIWAFSENDIWFASGSIYHWDGENTSLEWMRDISSIETVEAVWGSSPENIYFVGNAGTIVHYDGSGFTRLESGTELHILDILGTFNPVSEEWEVICVGSKPLIDPEFKKIILKIDGHSVSSLNLDTDRDESYLWTVSSVWFVPDRQYLIAGGGIYRKHQLNDTLWKTFGGMGYYISGLRGTAINDIVAVGGYFEILHYNGINWQRLDPGIPRTGNFKSVAVKDDLVVVVGLNSRSGVIWKGQRF